MDFLSHLCVYLTSVSRALHMHLRLLDTGDSDRGVVFCPRGFVGGTKIID